MKNRLIKFQSILILILLNVTLFVINPFFTSKHLNAERIVQNFKDTYKPEYDSLISIYDIDFEQINFKNDSAENVVNQKYTLLKHEIEMHYLNRQIPEEEYQRKVSEIIEMEYTENSIISDSFTERLIRLDFPKERKVPNNLTKKVILYRGVDGFIGIMKWLMVVVSIVVLLEIYFKKRNAKKNANTDFKQTPMTNGFKKQSEFLRHDAEAQIRQFAKVITNIDTGIIQFVETDTPKGTDKEAWYVVAGHKYDSNESILVRNTKGEQRFIPKSQVTGDIQEISVDDFANNQLVTLDLIQQQQKDLENNTINYNGIDYVMNGEKTDKGFIGINPQDGSDIEIPFDIVDTIRKTCQIK